MGNFYGTTSQDTFIGQLGENRFFFDPGELSSLDIVAGHSGTLDYLHIEGTQTVLGTDLQNVFGIEILYVGTGNLGASVELTNDLVTSSNSTVTSKLYVEGRSGDDTLDASGITVDERISLYGGLGNDTIHGGAGSGSQLVGQQGNDTIYLGTGIELALGEDDDDTFSGNLAELAGDSLDGGDGEDTLNITQAGGLLITAIDIEIINLANGINSIEIETFYGAPEADITINGSTGKDTITISTVPGAELFALPGFRYTIKGGADDDVLTGWIGNDTLLGQGDNDILYGGDGNDTLDGGLGSNILSGGDGDDIYDNVSVNDVIVELTSTGTDTIRTALTSYTMQYNVEILDYTGTAAVHFIGSSTNNTIEGSGLVDTLEGGGGDDTLNGLVGADFLFGNAGNDTLNGGIGADELNGGDDFDFLYGGQGNDILDGGLGDDVLSGEEDMDILNGGNGNDFLKGGLNVDELYGGGLDDILNGGKGGDILVGGDGNDFADYRNSTSGQVSINLLADTASGGEAAGDTLDQMENLMGSLTRRDILIGDTGDNIIYGFGGNDSLRGEDGNDYLEGGSGADALNCGAGTSDWIGYRNSFGAQVNINLLLNTASGADATGDSFFFAENVEGSFTVRDVIVGNDVANTVVGNGGDDSIRGEAGNDIIDGGTGADGLNAGVGLDTVVYEKSSVGVTIDLNNALQASAGDANGDTLYFFENVTGSAFGDSVIGNYQSNTLLGGAGADTLNGFTGSDYLTGGTEADTFRFADSAFGSDTITDWTDGNDIISISTSIATLFTDLTITDNGTTRAVVRITGVAGSAIIVQNTTAFTLDASDFVFV